MSGTITGVPRPICKAIRRDHVVLFDRISENIVVQTPHYRELHQDSSNGFIKSAFQAKEMRFSTSIQYAAIVLGIRNRW